MISEPKILVFAGSARAGSYNVQLAKYCSHVLSEFGAEVSFVDMKNYVMPLYDGDLESSSGLPETALQFKELMTSHHAFLIASPEYNSSVTPLLKNTIDWVSRPIEGESSLAAFRGKFAALVSASPGALGGMRGLVHLRSILGNIGVWVMPDQVALPKAHEAFDESGDLTDDGSRSRIQSLAENLLDVVRRVS